MINRERVKFKLAPSRWPSGKSYISGYVKVSDFEGGGYAHIRFSRDFVDFVAKTMPDGLREDRMVYINVIQLSHTQWLVLANYLDGSRSEILWVSESKPTWLVIRKG